MNNEELIKEINILKGELEKTKNELVETKEHLKKYTAPSNMKKYYQNHKEEIIKKVKEYKEKNNYKPNIDKEKRKEYNKLAYQKRKEKIEKEKVRQNVIKEFYYMKERKMVLLKKKHNYQFKIANQLIMKISKCILLRKIN